MLSFTQTDLLPVMCRRAPCASPSGGGEGLTSSLLSHCTCLRVSAACPGWPPPHGEHRHRRPTCAELAASGGSETGPRVTGGSGVFDYRLDRKPAGSTRVGSRARRTLRKRAPRRPRSRVEPEWWGRASLAPRPVALRCFGCDISVTPSPAHCQSWCGPPRVSWLRVGTSISLSSTLPPPPPLLEPELILLQVFISTCFVVKPMPSSGDTPAKACPHGACSLPGKPTLRRD